MDTDVGFATSVKLTHAHCGKVRTFPERHHAEKAAWQLANCVPETVIYLSLNQRNLNLNQ